MLSHSFSFSFGSESFLLSWKMKYCQEYITRFFSKTSWIHELREIMWWTFFRGKDTHPTFSAETAVDTFSVSSYFSCTQSWISFLSIHTFDFVRSERRRGVKSLIIKYNVFIQKWQKSKWHQLKGKQTQLFSVSSLSLYEKFVKSLKKVRHEEFGDPISLTFTGRRFCRWKFFPFLFLCLEINRHFIVILTFTARLTRVFILSKSFYLLTIKSSSWHSSHLIREINSTTSSGFVLILLL